MTSSSTPPHVLRRLAAADDNSHILPPPSPRRDSCFSTVSSDSRIDLLPRRFPPEQSSNCELPSFWSERLSREPDETDSAGGSWYHNILQGWRVVVFGSWLNVLFVFLPTSWILNIVMKNTNALVFVCCVLALIPLVRLHDLSTRDLAIRIGGSKTGLLNASMSNMVETVFAISALRKCELRIVQSSLVGSILSKLLLVLGLCFFAGGMRFSEQGFDATATQIHSSLLSISVGAILLPVVYHFTLNDARDDSALALQKRNILHMSYGVSIVLLIIYMAYLVFQLWSHTHLYDDQHNKTSNRLSLSLSSKFNKVGKTVPRNGDGRNIPVSPTKSMYNTSQVELTSLRKSSSALSLPPLRIPSTSTMAYATSSEIALSSDYSEKTVRLYPDQITGGLVRGPGGGGVPLTRESTLVTSSSCALTREESIESPTRLSSKFAGLRNLGNTSMGTESPILKKPRMSKTLTIILLILVTIAVAVTADILVETMDGVSGVVRKEWVGLIVLPAISSVAECITAMKVSVKDELTLSISSAVGSTVQTALCVIPFIVTLGWITGKPLSLLMDPFQSMVLYISVQTMGYVVADGKSNWLEGLILICLYVIIAVSFWFYPGSDIPNGLATCVALD